jgi:hypothetical protein
LPEKRIRAADAKEVGVGNPAEETYRYPNQNLLIAHIKHRWSIVNSFASTFLAKFLAKLAFFQGKPMCDPWAFHSLSGAGRSSSQGFQRAKIAAPLPNRPTCGNT